jgi:hypothetical protein
MVGRPLAASAHLERMSLELGLTIKVEEFQDKVKDRLPNDVHAALRAPAWLIPEDSEGAIDWPRQTGQPPGASGRRE